jgi:hypothetical protein
MIDVVYVGIVRAVKISPSVELKPCHVLIVSDGDGILLELQPVRCDLVMDHLAEHVVQRLLRRDMLGPLADHRTQFGLRDDCAPIRVNHDRFAMCLRC